MENEYRKWFNENRARKALEAFREKGWTGYYAETILEARALLFNTCLPQGVSVGLGGSATLKAMDILSELRSGKYQLYDRYNRFYNDNNAEHLEICRNSLMADYFITGANALTMDGMMVNLDCSGSRVAAMAYGPRHIIVVAGANKLTATLEAAIARARSIAPMNCKRGRHQTPCLETGFCREAAGAADSGMGCNIPARMCNHLLITLNAQKFTGKYNLILINDELGF